MSISRIRFSVIFLIILTISVQVADTTAATAIVGGTVVDLEGKAPIENAVIVVEGERIATIGKAGSVEIPDDAEQIDAKGAWLIPGLMNMHVHLGLILPGKMKAELYNESEAALALRMAANARETLLAGITTIRLPGDTAHADLALMRAINKGQADGPRIFSAGEALTITAGHGSKKDGKTNYDGPDELVKAARTQISAGAKWIKILISGGIATDGGGLAEALMTPEEIRAVIDAGHRFGVKVTAHSGSPAMMAISKIAHENDVPIYTHAINLDEFHSAVVMSSTAIVHRLEDPIPPGDTILQDMVENNVMFVPTHSLWEAFLRHDEAATDLNDPILRDSVPHFLLDYMQDPDYRAEETRRFLAVANMPVYKWAEEKIPIFSENILKAHQAGVIVATGTDAGGPVGYNFQGYNLPWEVKLFVQAGMTPMEALVAATRNGAMVSGVEDQLGTVEAGKLADLLILSANPLDDINNIRKIEKVVYKGKAYPREEFAYKPPDGSY